MYPDAVQVVTACGARYNIYVLPLWQNIAYKMNGFELF